VNILPQGTQRNTENLEDKNISVSLGKSLGSLWLVFILSIKYEGLQIMEI